MRRCRPHDPFRDTGGPGCIEDITRISPINRHTVSGFNPVNRIMPDNITALDHRGRHLGPLIENAGFGFVFAQLNGPIEQRFVFNDPGGFNPAGCRDNHFGGAVINPLGQLTGGKPAKHHRMDRTEPHHRQHGHNSLRDHRHVDDNAVTLFQPPCLQRTGKSGDLMGQLIIGIGPG